MFSIPRKKPKENVRLELKYQRGMISKNALLTAEDELKTAQESVQTAQDNLFSTYNNYRWAVDHGVLN